LQQLGWIDGRNVRIDHRLAGSNAEDLRKICGGTCYPRSRRFVRRWRL
jgi:hypothetical protein